VAFNHADYGDWTLPIVAVFLLHDNDDETTTERTLLMENVGEAMKTSSGMRD